MEVLHMTDTAHIKPRPSAPLKAKEVIILIFQASRGLESVEGSDFWWRSLPSQIQSGTARHDSSISQIMLSFAVVIDSRTGYSEKNVEIQSYAVDNTTGNKQPKVDGMIDGGDTDRWTLK